MGNSVISKYVFIPPETTYTETYPYKIDFTPTKTGKKVPLYFLPAKRRSKNKPKTTILYSHGNAADIGAMFDFLLFLHTNLPNVNILHYEYIGYGLAKSQGSPSESATYESIEAAFSYLERKHGIHSSDCIVFGTSVGSGPSCHVASKFPCKGLILECPFTSCVRVVTNNVLGRPIDMFTNINKIDKVPCPIMIMHGKQDSIVPFDHGVELWKRVSEPCKFRSVWVEGADHHSIIPCLTHAKYIQNISDFIQHCDSFESPKSVSNMPKKKTSKFKMNFSSPADDVEFSVKPEFLKRDEDT